MPTESKHITAARHDFKVMAGDTLPINFVFTDKETRAPISLEGSAVVMKIKVLPTDTVAVKTLSLGSGLTLSGDDYNVIQLSTLLDIPKGTYSYSLTATATDGTVTTYMVGKIYAK